MSNPDQFNPECLKLISRATSQPVGTDILPSFTKILGLFRTCI